MCFIRQVPFSDILHNLDAQQQAAAPFAVTAFQMATVAHSTGCTAQCTAAAATAATAVSVRS
jgi:hypothetical protein